MRRFPGSVPTCIVFLSFLLLLSPRNSAASPDSKLLSLVTPDARIMAGMDVPPPKDRPGGFVLITRSNRVDLMDYFALTGADSTRSVQHALFVASDGNLGDLDEHSLLMSGHFDQPRIYKSIEAGGDAVTDYHGIPVLIIQPLARERSEFNETRWLAIPDPNLLLFGSILSVRGELDRYLAGSAAEPSLLRKLAGFRHDDETWCVLIAPARNPEIRSQLQSLDVKLADLAGDADEFRFGMRYRKQVEFEYEVTTASATTTHSIADSLRQAFAGLGAGNSLLASEPAHEGDRTAHGSLKIPIPRFGAWLHDPSHSLSEDNAPNDSLY